jgi:F0F1-type ATP synthase membrane subunit c/vacuolar-type H+-ATPase subunit K
MKLTLGARRISVEWAVLSAGVTIGLAIAIAALLVVIFAAAAAQFVLRLSP